MTNLEGRVLLRRAARSPRRRASAPTWRSSRELAERLGGAGRFADRPARRSSTSCAGPAPGGPADYAGITYERLDAETGVFWPCPATEHPGTPRLFLDRFATPDGRARFVPVEHRPAAEEPRRRLPALPDHRPGARALPVRRADPPGRRARRGRAGAVRRAPPRPGRAARRSTTASRCGCVSRRGEARGAGPGQRRDPAATPSSCRSTGPGGGQPAHQRRARPDRRGCRSSRSAPCRVERDRMRLVVVGNGMAGVAAGQRAARAATAHAARSPCSAPSRPAVQPGPAVERAGRQARRRRRSRLLDPAWYADHGVDGRARAARSTCDRPGDPAPCITADGRREPYDVLVLATGSQAGRAAACPGAGRRSASPFRTLDDCRRILDGAPRRARRAVVRRRRAARPGGGPRAWPGAACR